MPKKGSGGPRQQFQPGPQYQLPQQFPTMMGQQPQGQANPGFQQPHVPQNWGDGFAPYTGDNKWFQRIHERRAAGQHPLLNFMFQQWGQ